jgi:hypothetical protein
MDRQILIKKIIGTILALLLFPVLFGFIEDHSFAQGFLIGLLTDVTLIALGSFIFLILWLFGFFD